MNKTDEMAQEQQPRISQVNQRTRMYGSTGPFNNSSGNSSRRFANGELMNTTHGSQQPSSKAQDSRGVVGGIMAGINS